MVQPEGRRQARSPKLAQRLRAERRWEQVGLQHVDVDQTIRLALGGPYAYILVGNACLDTHNYPGWLIHLG